MSNLPVAAPEYLITLLSGPEKGATFKIVSGRISIGRGADNDISLSYDNKASRNHAWISVTPNGAEITDVSDKNKIFVNGDETSRLILRDKAVIQLGETKLQFRIMKTEVARAPMAISDVDIFKSNAMGIKQGPSGSIRPRTSASGISKVHMIIVALVAVVGYYMWSKPAAKPPPQAGIRTEDEVNRDVSSVETETAKILSDRASRGENSPNFMEVNAHYIRGKRDYESGNYQRAVDSFQACLSMKPDHPKCQQYLTASSRGFWSMVDDEIRRGLKLKEQNQFSSCSAAFENVKNLVTDQTNKKYMEAEANRKFCEEKSKDRF